MDETKWEKIKKGAIEDCETYFNDNSENRKIDISKLKNFMTTYSNRYEIPMPNEDDMDYLLKFYSEGNNFLNKEQFLVLLQTLQIVRGITSKKKFEASKLKQNKS